MSNSDPDFFTDASVHANLLEYWESMREHGPVWRDPSNGMLVITGYNEALEVYRDNASFSACNAGGPLVEDGVAKGFAVPLSGHDVSQQIDDHSHLMPISDLFLTFDPPKHTAHRSLSARQLTPSRVRGHEELIERLCNRQIDTFVKHGNCDFVEEYALPFALLTVATVLGVPEAEHKLFLHKMDDFHQGEIREGENPSNSPTEVFGQWFSEYVPDHRRHPRDDLLSEVANARFPDGSLPEVEDVVRIATFLLAAGQETTASLLSFSLQEIAEHPELQQHLRENPDDIANFVEEMLRLESPAKANWRLARVDTTIAGMEVPAGTTIMILVGATNRDPRRFECPADFRGDRPDSRQHLAFGHGIHLCVGAHLARSEARISIQRILERMDDIRISDAHHGPAGARHYEYEHSYILRGLTSLHLEFVPTGVGN